MAKQGFTACRICHESVEPSDLPGKVNIYTNIVAQIKEVIGVELTQGVDLPSSICGQCLSELKTAEEFRRKCIDSNEYFEFKRQQNNLKSELIIKEENPLELGDGTEFEEEYVKSEKEDIAEKDDATEKENNTENEQSQGEDGAISRNSPTKCKTSLKLISERLKMKKKLKEYQATWRQKQKFGTPVICHICGNVFKAKHFFAMHMRRHSDNKPYDCELCSSRFYTNSELKRHMRRHTGEKPYECHYCHRKFSDYGTHIKHERTHTNDRPFSCNQCDKSFSCTFVLKNHMLIHTGERAFRCEVCDKSFGRLHNLTTHMKSNYHQKNSLIKSIEGKKDGN